MGTTTGGLPYPESTDPIAAGADAIKALALAVDVLEWEKTFTTIVLATGWSTTTGGYIRTRDGRFLMMRGQVTRTGADIPAGTATTVATLPAGYRPGAWYRAVIASGANPWACRIQISPSDGVMTLSNPMLISTNGYVHLDGIMFTTFA